MGPRISISLVILAVFAIVLAYTVGHKTGGSGNTAIASGVTTVECKTLPSVKKELQSQQFTVDSYGKSVKISGLVFTPCVDPTLYITPQTLDMIYENVKEQLYLANAQSKFETAVEVKISAATAADRLIKIFPEYQGRMVIYVETNPGTPVHFAAHTSPTP